MNNRFESKCVLVTGGGTGIGAAISLAFLEEGARVMIGQSTQDNADHAVARLRAAGVKADSVYGVGADLSSAAGCKALVDKAVAVLGQLDILVNNAGLVGGGARSTLEETTDELLDRIIDVNLKAPFRLVRNASKHLRSGAVIVNIGSTAAFRALNRFAAYSISKAGVEMLTQAAALELGERQIRVVGIAPGDIVTPGADADPAFTPGMDLPVAGHTSALGRQGRAAEVAAAVLFASSDAASYVTGTTVVVDGGGLIR